MNESVIYLDNLPISSFRYIAIRGLAAYPYKYQKIQPLPDQRIGFFAYFRKLALCQLYLYGLYRTCLETLSKIAIQV